MAYWPNTIRYTKPSEPIMFGDGENTALTSFEIKKSESSYSRNLSSRAYPALSMRLGRASALTAITTPNATGERNNQYMHVQDGTVWKRWDGSAWQNVQTGLTSATGKFIEFSTGTTKNTILVNGTDKYSWNGTAVTNLTNAPASKLIATGEGRLYIARDNDIQFSAINLINDWSSTGDDGAGSIDVTDAKGAISALTWFSGHCIAWTEFTMHELYGTGPNDYRLIDIPGGDCGCISDRTVVITGGTNNGRLMWLNYNGWMYYTGGTPKLLSDKDKTYIEGINTTYKTKCVAGVQGDYMYLSIPYGSSTTNNLIIEYDLKRGNIYPQTGTAVNFVTIGNALYAVNTDGTIQQMNSGTDDSGTAIPWSYITGVWNDGVYQKKTVSSLYAIIDLPATSTLVLSYSTTIDGDDFVSLYTFTGSATEQGVYITVPLTKLQNINWRRLKWEGTGPCTVYYAYEPRTRIKPR